MPRSSRSAVPSAMPRRDFTGYTYSALTCTLILRMIGGHWPVGKCRAPRPVTSRGGDSSTRDEIHVHETNAARAVPLGDAREPPHGAPRALERAAGARSLVHLRAPLPARDRGGHDGRDLRQGPPRPLPRAERR